MKKKNTSIVFAVAQKKLVQKKQLAFYFLWAVFISCTASSNAQNYNTSYGDYALIGITTGSYNTAYGNSSLKYNSSGSFNTGYGWHSLYSNQTGSCNTAVGTGALNYNTGHRNTAVGYYSLYGNKNGVRNVAIGYRALNSSVSNDGNVAIGDSTLYKYNDGTYTDYLVAVGQHALTNNTVGYNNTAVGGRSLVENITGVNNTANGVFALISNTTGGSNTAVGFSALSGNITGHYNTAIGSGANVSSNALTNATAIGSGAIATANNQIMLGNTSVTSVKAAGSFVIMSDGRFKNNRKEDVPGLAFIKELKPVTYNYNIHKLNDYLKTDKNKIETGRASNCCVAEEEAAIVKKERKLYSGFIAQEVEAVANKLGYEFSGLYKPQNDKDAYGISYADFVVPLVKAVQELAKQNEDLQKQINELKAVKTTGAKIDVSSQTSTKIALTDASLEQNKPNPFVNTTSIHYNIPAGAKNAQLTIVDHVGKTIKQISLHAGTSVVNVDASALSSGTYSYTLLVDGKLIENKKMTVVH
jgi:hypothetical protein